MREQDSGSTCLRGGLSIYLTPLTSGGFLVYVMSPQLPVARTTIGCPGPLLFPPHSLILRGLATSPRLLSHQSDRAEEKRTLRPPRGSLSNGGVGLISSKKPKSLPDLSPPSSLHKHGSLEDCFPFPLSRLYLGSVKTSRLIN